MRPLFRKMIDPMLSVFTNGADAFLTYTSYADQSLIRDHNIDSKKYLEHKIQSTHHKFTKKLKDFYHSLEIRKRAWIN